MQIRQLGSLWPVSALTLGGGGIGQVWGQTSRAEAVATVRLAVERGVTLLDLAPGYGRGEAESVVGEAFAGNLPEGVRVTTKCQLGSPPALDIAPMIQGRLERSLAGLKLERVDLLFLHSNIVPDDYHYPDPELQDRFATRWSLYQDEVIPTFEALKAQGLIGDWGITGVGLPATIRQALASDPGPAAVQCVANCLNSAGDMRRYAEPAEPRSIIASATSAGVGVMGIRAVQAGALTDGFDRDMTPSVESADRADFDRAVGFRELAAAQHTTPARLAHRYALSMNGVDTVVLGVKNRTELQECLAAEEDGPLSADEIAAIDSATGIA
jgi:aryl-alcohol dehydrogenase-like predicted oxidoreductase